MHRAYQNLIRSRIISARNDAAALSGITHGGLKGHLREIVIRDLFRPLMPADIGLGSGEVVAANGATSSEQDVVIFDRSILPPILMEAAGMFPIESVLYTIEIKSRLERGDLVDANASATAMRNFPVLSGIYDPQDQPTTHQVQRTLHALLAFDTQVGDVVSSMTEIAQADPSLTVICVVGRGYWFWDNRRNSWVTWPTADAFNETVAFLSGVMNTIPDVRASRHHPRVGNYLL